MFESSASSIRVRSLLDVLRTERDALIRQGQKPIKLLVRNECMSQLVECARAEGEFENASPAQILDLPIMLADRLIAAEEGAHIVCEGDEMHREIQAYRSAVCGSD